MEYSQRKYYNDNYNVFTIKYVNTFRILFRWISTLPLKLQIYNPFRATNPPSSFLNILEQTVHWILQTSISTSVDHNESVNIQRQSINEERERQCSVMQNFKETTNMARGKILPFISSQGNVNIWTTIDSSPTVGIHSASLAYKLFSNYVPRLSYKGVA